MNTAILDFAKAAGLSGRIVDVGSYNVNGQIRDVVDIECGIDMRKGKGVDRVMLAEDMHEHFSNLDAVTCCEMMEHVEHWREALASIWQTIRLDGTLLFSVPTREKGYHAHPEDYWRWSEDQLRQIFSAQEIVRLIHAGCSWALHVIKRTDKLDLSPEPHRVLPKSGAKKPFKSKKMTETVTKPVVDNGKGNQDYKERMRAKYANYKSKHG